MVTFVLLVLVACDIRGAFVGLETAAAADMVIWLVEMLLSRTGSDAAEEGRKQRSTCVEAARMSIDTSTLRRRIRGT